MRGPVQGFLAAVLISALAGCVAMPPAGAVAGNEGEAVARRVVDRFSLPCKSVDEPILFHGNTLVAAMDGCKSGVVQDALYVRKYGPGRGTNLIFPQLLMDTPLEGGNMPRTWIEDDGSLNWLAPSRKLGCLAYSRLPDPVKAKAFFGTGSSTCLEDVAGEPATHLNVWSSAVRLSDGDIFLHVGKTGAVYRRTGDVYRRTRVIDPQVIHTPSALGERFDSLRACAEGLAGQLLCQARFAGNGNPDFYSREMYHDSGLAVIDLKANQLHAYYQRGTWVLNRPVASSKGLLVTAVHGGPRRLAWTVVDSTGRLVHDDKTDPRGVIPIERGPEWGYGTPAFSPDGAFLYVFRSDKLIDVFSTAPFERRATLSTAQLGITEMGFVAVDKSNGRVAICGDRDCAIIEGWK